MQSVETPVTGESPWHVGYFSHHVFGEKHVGAILVTNQIGIPVEFKYTEPVETTRLHRILYGASLERHLRETVLRDCLGRAIQAEPEFFLTGYEEREYLGPMAGRAMMAIQRASLSKEDAASRLSRIRDKEGLVELEDGMMLRVAFSTRDDSVQQRMIGWLRATARFMDVMEPMDRIEQALRFLCDNVQEARTSSGAALL